MGGGKSPFPTFVYALSKAGRKAPSWIFLCLSGVGAKRVFGIPPAPLCKGGTREATQSRKYAEYLRPAGFPL